MRIISGDNIYYLTGGKADNGYVFNLSAREEPTASRNMYLIARVMWDLTESLREKMLLLR